eukprot:SM000350S13030  [mRNA]  locus=s350:4470:8186:+ [translate_table: standard]
MLLPAFGVKGQAVLAKAAVLVVGAGGLASPVILYLAAAGLGKLGIVDPDVVELNNLHRQVVHTEASVGQQKVNSAATACHRINSSMTVETFAERMTNSNALEMIGQYDVVVDCTDNVQSRYIVNDACIIAGRPLVAGAALGLEGQLSVYGHEEGPCYRCLFPVPPPQAACTRCSDAGVLGIVPGIMGCLQALEALKLATGMGETLAGRMLLLDAFTSRITTVKLRGKSPDCAVCGPHPKVTPINYQVINYGAFTGSAPDDKAPAWKRELPPSQAVTCKEYQHLAEQGELHVLLDVRAAHEYAIAALPKARNIPLLALQQRITEVQDLARGRTPPAYTRGREADEHAVKSSKGGGLGTQSGGDPLLGLVLTSASGSPTEAASSRHQPTGSRGMLVVVPGGGPASTGLPPRWSGRRGRELKDVVAFPEVEAAASIRWTREDELEQEAEEAFFRASAWERGGPVTSRDQPGAGAIEQVDENPLGDLTVARRLARLGGLDSGESSGEDEEMQLGKSRGPALEEDSDRRVQQIAIADAQAAERSGSMELLPVYVICRRGVDSQVAVQLLQEAGVCTALDVTGGLEAWRAQVNSSFPAY